MAKPDKTAQKPKARLPKGMRDIGADELRQTQAMLEKIRTVYERYGFEPLETPAFEYTDALGKFLPDSDRPNEGVFSFQDEDEQWLSLRYDLTAPLARYVAENYQDMPKPFRRYATGSVFRNEKPGPGRFRQFTQFDADTVGAESVAADAEMCMLAADTLEALGIERGQYVIKINSRKIFEGIRETNGVGSDEQWLTALRAIDKADRLGFDEVKKLLTSGRTDASGDRTPGAGLSIGQASRIIAAIDSLVATLGPDSSKADEFRTQIRETIDKLDKLGPQANAAIIFSKTPSEAVPAELANDDKAAKIFQYLSTRYYDDSADVLERAKAVGEQGPVRYAWGERSFPSDAMTLSAWRDAVGSSEVGRDGVDELENVISLVRAAGYGPGRIILDPSIVRGLEYYTGPVFEAELLIPAPDEKGNPVRFGSVGGGGRYDDLVARFTGQKVPATGFSIGVSRLQAALNLIGRAPAPTLGPVVVTVMDKDRIADYQKFVQRLRQPDDGGPPIRAELYLGNPKKFPKQLEYADKRGSPVVVIQGSNEREAGQIILKDMIEGAKAAAAIKDNKEWKETRPAQVTVAENDLVAEVRKILARHT